MAWLCVNAKFIEHLNAMKYFVRKQPSPWQSQGDGYSWASVWMTVASCFELYGDNKDWGNIYN